MRAKLLLTCLLFASFASAQITSDVMGMHDLSPSGISPVKGSLNASCLYCHAPHSGVGGQTPLWNQTLSTQTYTPYQSSTFVQKQAQPMPGASSSLCLSCHDGTVAPGLTAAYGKMTMTGSMSTVDQFGTNLQTSHPFSLVLPMKDAPDLVASLVSQGKTADPTGAVALINGNIECTTCHNPHVQAIDRNSQTFLVRDGSNGQICLACHDPNRVTTGQTNSLANWPTSVHATVGNAVSAQAGVGMYGTVASNSCSSCHGSHNSAGPSRILRGADQNDCIACHDGAGTNVTPAAPNVFAEFAKKGHPFPAGTNTHDAAESAVLNQNRHATCVDCHNPHASNQVLSFTTPPVIRLSQSVVAGVDATDGVTTLNPAVNQYENCLRCHGTSTGKATQLVYGYTPLRAVSAADPLNIIPQFALTAISSHPVTHDRTSGLPQPSLLTYMVNLDGATQGRLVGTRILCTDCHNADDNREFGGAGPNGPHGSKWDHILERRYDMSQAPAPGQPISTNLYPNPDLTVNGPYALCAKCHDLTKIVANTSWSEHARHINDGFSCSTCHTSHGMGATSTTISGERMVNFDITVVAPNGTTPISYNRTNNTCSLICHNQAH